MSSHVEIMTSASTYSKRRTISSYEHLSRLCLDDLTERGVSLHEQEQVLIRLLCTTMPHADEISHTQQLIPSPPPTSLSYEKVRDDNHTREATSTSNHIYNYDDDDDRRDTALGACHSPISNTAEPERVSEPIQDNGLPEYQENEDICTFPDADSYIWRDNSITGDIDSPSHGSVKLKMPPGAINNPIVLQDREDETLVRDETDEHQDFPRETDPVRQLAEATTSTIHETGHDPLSARLSTTRALLHNIADDELMPTESPCEAQILGQKRRLSHEDRDSSYTDGGPSDDEVRTPRPRKQRKKKVAQTTAQETRTSTKATKLAQAATSEACLRAKKKIERAKALATHNVLPGITLKQILDVTLAKLDNVIAKADIADLCIRLFHTEKAFHIIYQGGQHEHQADEPSLANGDWDHLSSLVNDPSHLLQGKTDDDHQSMLNQLKMHEVYLDQELHLRTTCDVASLIISNAYDGEITGAARSEAEHRLHKLNKQSAKLLLLKKHLGSGSLVMLSSTSWRAALHRIQYVVLERSLQTMTERFPDLVTIFDKLELNGLDPNRPAINLKYTTDFAEFMNGEHCGSIASGRRRTVLKGKRIASRTIAASQISGSHVQELEDVDITVQQHNRPNQAPVAAMASRSCQ